MLWSGVAGLAAAATFPPIGWWPLATIAYIPLLWCWRQVTPRQAALCGAVFGVVAFGVICAWMWYFGVVAFGPFLLGMAAFPTLTGYLVALLRNVRIRGPWIEAAVWVTIEGLRTRVPFGGMPWATAGTALAPFAPTRSLAPIGGVLLVSFVCIVCNGALLDLGEGFIRMRRGWSWRPFRRAALTSIAVVVIVVSAWAWWPQGTTSGTLHYALLQANNLNRPLTQTELDDNYLLESHFGLAEQLDGPLDLIVFPESALGGIDPEVDASVRDRVVRLATRYNSWVMLNVNEEANGTTYNTNRIYAPDGTLIASYRKQHLVPFGEFVPLEWLRTLLPQLEQVGSGYSPGKGSIAVPVAGHPLTTVICFENAFSGLVRDATGRGAQGIVVSTNNRSYRRSANAAQHVQLSQWRAAELGRPILHAAISGISADIDAQGTVRAHTELFERTTLRGVATTTRGTTPYARFGDWVLLACLASTIAVVLLAIVRLRVTPPRPQHAP
ncbi:MAG: apolipoprotein N-acyltransferase [Acidimicrobiia bacterium]